MKYPAYPQYKDSGVVWLGEVPEDWGVWKLSHGFDQTVSGTTPPSDNEDWYDGETPWVTTSELRETVITETAKKVSQTAIQTFSALKIFPKDSLAIAMYGATIGWLGIFGVPATTNQACCVMFGEKVLAIKFSFYWFQAFREQIILLASGGGQPNISQEKIRSLRIACPIISDQTAIADFLDRETGRIDTLVAKKRKLVELLKEKRSALISRTVTRGLPADAAREFGLTTGDTAVREAPANYGRGDFNRPQAGANEFAPTGECATPGEFKDSGVEWLGEVPAHWEFKQLKWAVMFQRGHDLPSDARIEGTVPIVSSAGISGAHNLAIAKAPGIVTGRYGTIGQFYLLLEDYWPLNTTLYSINLYGNHPVFLRYYLEHLSPLVLLHSVKSAVPGVDRNDLHPTMIALPPVAEQTAIAAYLDRETAKIDQLVAKVDMAITRLQEYRSALITAAVPAKSMCGGLHER